MRYVAVRLWAVLATAILAAAASDAVTEFAQNSGWLGHGLADNQHEAVLPALILGAVVAGALAFFVLLARIYPADPLLSRIGGLRSRVADTVASLLGSALCIVAMEGYETSFGGVSPFDPRSVVLSHAVPLILALAIIGALVHHALRAAVGAASRASLAVAVAVASFFRTLRIRGLAPRTVRLSAFVLFVTHVSPAISAGSRGLRAPPRSIDPGYVIA
jgi:hypothetical protein